MDFKQTLLLVINEMNNQKVDYGLIGGFALGLYGVDRSTSDLDFMINFKDIDKIKEILLENGFELLFFSDNVLQFVSPIKDFGEIDVLVAKREISINMLENAVNKSIFGGSIDIRILKPEDLIGLKLQAIKNDENNIIDYDILFKKQKAVSSTNNVSDPDKYIEFVSFYNEFINHRPKKFKPIKGAFVF